MPLIISKFKALLCVVGHRQTTHIYMDGRMADEDNAGDLLQSPSENIAKGPKSAVLQHYEVLKAGM